MHRSPLLARLALIPFGLAITVVGLELVLQLGALVVRATGSEAPAAWATGARRILCVGDSNTFGLWMQDRERESYPGQLEALWNEGFPSSPIEVLNLGFPGANSSMLRRKRRMIESLDPRIVLAMIGNNDAWTEAVAVEMDDERSSLDLWELLRRHSRLHRGFFMLRRQLNPTELEIERFGQGVDGVSAVARFEGEEIQLGWTRAQSEVESPWPRLRANLRALVEEAASSRAELVLMTYPARAGFYRAANAATRAVAAESGTRLIDLEAIFNTRCPTDKCPDWLLADNHPTAKGYRLVAETIVKRLAADAQ